MPMISEMPARHGLLRVAPAAAILMSVGVLAACAREEPRPVVVQPAPTYVAPAPAPAPVMVPRARG